MSFLKRQATSHKLFLVYHVPTALCDVSIEIAIVLRGCRGESLFVGGLRQSEDVVTRVVASSSDDGGPPVSQRARRRLPDAAVAFADGRLGYWDDAGRAIHADNDVAGHRRRSR